MSNRLIYNKLKLHALASSNVADFKVGSKGYRNAAEAIGVSWPCIWVYPIRTKLVMGRYFAGADKTYTILGTIATVSIDNDSAADLDSPLEKLEDTVRRMSLITDEFAQRLIQDADMIEVFDFNYEDNYHMFAQNEVGVAFSCTFKLREVIPDVCI